jgi:hypothetical protein
MSEMLDTSPETYFPLLHAMLRATPATKEENDRAREVVKWAAGHRSRISKMLDEDEINLFEHIVRHWTEHKEAPNHRTLEELVRQDIMFEPQLGILGDYAKTWQPQLHVTDVVEFRNLLKMRFDAWTKLMFLFVTQEARIIATSGQLSGNYKDPPRRGVPDACRYLIKELFSDVFQPGGQDTGGSMLELADDLMEHYQDIEDAREAGNLKIPSGIQLIDDLMGGGFERKTLNLILGTAGHRKTAVARTAAYWAALAGFRVLFIPLEWPWQEELAIFSMMHGHNYQFQGAEELSIRRFRDGLLNKDEEEAIVNFLVPALKQELGTNLVIRSVEDKTWQNIRQLIEAENANGPLDLIVIDYITMFELGKGFDKNYEMHQAVRELKQLALHINDDRGAAILSPVQGSRNGYNEAVAADGTWQKTGIWQYGEMEKSADNILYTFMPDEQIANKIKLGFCKTRRHGTPPPLLVEVDPQVGIVGGSPIVMAARVAMEEDIAALATGIPAKTQVKVQGIIKGKRKPKPVSGDGLSVAEVRQLFKGPAKAWR